MDQQNINMLIWTPFKGYLNQKIGMEIQEKVFIQWNHALKVNVSYYEYEYDIRDQIFFS